MTKKQLHDMIVCLFKELEILLHDVYGKDYVASIETTEDSITMYTENFLISYDYEESKFSVSFLVGLTGNETAKYMTCILSIFEPHEIQFLSDSYYDKSTNQLVFGQEAIEVKQRDVLESVGKSKCVMCEYVYPIEYVEQNVCRQCKKTYDRFKWH